MSHTLAVRPVRHDHGWREHVTTAASAAATLAVILGCATLARGGPGVRPPESPENPRGELTVPARRALDELRFAYQADDAVVVPAATDPNLTWSSAVSDDRIVGQPVPLGARGLVGYGYLNSSTEAPAWIASLTREDRVFSNAGPLWFACTRWPGDDECEASILIHHDLEYYFFRSGLGSADFLEEGAPMEVFTFDSVSGTERQQLLIGGLGGTDTDKVLLTLVDGSEVTAWTDKTLAMAGETMWWSTVSLPVESVTAYDAAGEVVARARPPT